MQSPSPPLPWYADANLITAWATALGVLAALFGVFWQIQHARFSTGVELLQEFQRRFDEPEMIGKRARVARSLLDKQRESSQDVLNFFEELGMLTHRGALDAKLVWHAFGNWILIYADAAEFEIQKEMEGDPFAWSELRYLVGRLQRIENRGILRGLLGRPTPMTRLLAGATAFLEEEAALAPRDLRASAEE